jgi:peptide/nickel transport system permease protein
MSTATPDTQELIPTGEELLPEPKPGGAHHRREWVDLLVGSLRFGRTKVGLVIVVAIVALALIGPYLAPHSPFATGIAPDYSGPSAKTLLGTDGIGRDVFSRVLCGGRTVIGLALAATVIGMILGVALGLLAGYSRPAVDDVIMRLLDVLLAFPQIVFMLLLVSVLGHSLWLLVLATAVAHAPRIARVARGATLEIVGRDFVRASEALGVPRRRILVGEILPNITSPLLVEFGLRLTYSIGLIAAMSFLGFGMQPPAADWGLMINENRVAILIQPWAVFVPVLLIALLTIGTNLMTDGLSRAMIGIDRDTGAK